MTGPSDIYDRINQLKPAPQRVPIPFWRCLRAFGFGTVELARIHFLYFAGPALLARALLYWALLGEGTLIFALTLLLETPAYLLLFPVRIMLIEVPRATWPLLETASENREFWMSTAHFGNLASWYLAPAAASTGPLLLVAFGAHFTARSTFHELWVQPGWPLATATILLSLLCAWFIEMGVRDKNTRAAKLAAKQASRRETLHGPDPLRDQQTLQDQLRRGFSNPTR